MSSLDFMIREWLVLTVILLVLLPVPLSADGCLNESFGIDTRVIQGGRGNGVIGINGVSLDESPDDVLNDPADQFSTGEDLPGADAGTSPDNDLDERDEASLTGLQCQREENTADCTAPDPPDGMVWGEGSVHDSSEGFGINKDEPPAYPEVMIPYPGFTHDIEPRSLTEMEIKSLSSLPDTLLLAEGNDHSISPSISADGRYIAFDSDATNLVTGDTNDRSDVFVHDRQTGTTTRVSIRSSGTQGDGNSSYPSISADGRYVAFHSRATNLVTGDRNDCSDVFVHDRQAGTTTRVSIRSSGRQGNGLSQYPSISADGMYIAFSSDATNLVTGDTNDRSDVFVHNQQTGTTTRVSVHTGDTQGNGHSISPSISADGRYIAFSSDATNLVAGDTNDDSDVFVRDRQAGTTTLVSVSSGGTQGDGNSYYPSISADGRYIAFDSFANNLVVGDAYDCYDVFLRDRQTGTTTLVSVRSGGSQGDGSSLYPSISADGRYIAFNSYATNLVLGDTNGCCDVFLRDRQTGTTTRVSLSSKESIGVFRGNTWYLDFNGNGMWNGPATDRQYTFGLAGDVPVTGDWNGDGITKIGVFRGNTWYLDWNGNGLWEGEFIDGRYYFGLAGDVPVTGDWVGNGMTKIGVFRGNTWYLDFDGNGMWNGPATDRQYTFGVAGDIPVTGDWDGNGITKIGVFRPGTHVFYLDWNGNGLWEGEFIDGRYNFGLAGDVPVTGDWVGNGMTKIGVFRGNTWYLDFNGNGMWNGPATDRQYKFGLAGDIPVTGAW